MGRARALVFASAAACALAVPAHAAAPRFILVSGHGLARPVVLADWAENGDFLAVQVRAPRVSGSAARGLRTRPRLDLALFWGWAETRRPTRLRDANQHGWFYPAWRGRPALVDLMVNGVRAPRVAPARALRILARHGIPTRI